MADDPVGEEVSLVLAVGALDRAEAVLEFVGDEDDRLLAELRRCVTRGAVWFARPDSS